MTTPFGPSIRTASGRDVPLVHPKPHHIDIADIAHHLALLNRFNGATSVPYSVAQHSCLVAQILEERGVAPAIVLAGLLHDAHEAYLGDVSTPAKRLLFGDVAMPSNYDDAAHVFDAAIGQALTIRLAEIDRRDIMLADMTALATEWRELMQGPCPTTTKPLTRRLRPIPWADAEDNFLRMFERLQALNEAALLPTA